MRARRLAAVVVAVVVIALLTGVPDGVAVAADPVKVVYHLNEGIPQATRSMRNIQNHLAADPTARIVVVAHGAGIDFLLKEAKDASGNAFSNHVDELSLRGVEFRVCQFTLETRRLEAARVVPEAKIVPSGVAEIARLQAREGYAYLKP
jgi:intracellular sulfur oxidation DsrE/DsrF family protein